MTEDDQSSMENGSGSKNRPIWENPRIMDKDALSYKDTPTTKLAIALGVAGLVLGAAVTGFFATGPLIFLGGAVVTGAVMVGATYVASWSIGYVGAKAKYMFGEAVDWAGSIMGDTKILNKIKASLPAVKRAARADEKIEEAPHIDGEEIARRVRAPKDNGTRTMREVEEQEEFVKKGLATEGTRRVWELEKEFEATKKGAKAEGTPPRQGSTSPPSNTVAETAWRDIIGEQRKGPDKEEDKGSAPSR